MGMMKFELYHREKTNMEALTANKGDTDVKLWCRGGVS